MNKGVCGGLSTAFNDICAEMDLASSTLIGKTKPRKIEKNNEVHEVAIGHAWNIVVIENDLYHIDIAYGIFERDKGRDKNKFFYDE